MSVTLTRVREKVKLNETLSMLKKGMGSLKTRGVRGTLRKIREKLQTAEQSSEYARTLLCSARELEEQRRASFPRNICISIAVPLHNTPLSFLSELIDSVQAQTYPNWELCLADGSDRQHEAVEQLCLERARKDERIRYKRLERNRGISGNTNVCLNMASGQYIGLLDHDDLLHPAALYEVMRAICEQEADFIYTDEAVFSGNTQNLTTVHLKPDFAIDNLRGNNYICHFSVFSKELQEQTGGFRQEYDGSQDHDFILRATERARKIVHISKVLYYWRSSKNSTAEDIRNKTYAFEAGIRAVSDHLQRVGLPATVESSSGFPAIYRIRYGLTAKPLVSIVICCRGDRENFCRCVTSVLENTEYENYELLLVGHKSAMPVMRSLVARTCEHKLRLIEEEKDGYVAMCGAGANRAAGDMLLLLDSNLKITSDDWLTEMLMYAQRPDVGAVGAEICFPSGRIDHAGYLLGAGKDGTLGKPFFGCDRREVGYMGRLLYSQNLSAVSSSCMLLRKKEWDEIGPFDEVMGEDFCGADLCLKLRQKGKLIVWTPYAAVIRQGSEERSPQDKAAEKAFRLRWAGEIAEGDPYYNRNFDLSRDDFSLPVVKARR